MTDHDVVVKRTEPELVVAITETINGLHDVASTQGRLWPRLHEVLQQAGLDHVPPSIAVERGAGPIELTAGELREIYLDCDGPCDTWVVESNSRSNHDKHSGMTAVGGCNWNVVASISMLHHVDATLGLRRMRELARPRGVVVIVGFARPSSAADIARAVAGTAYARLMKLRGRYWEHHAPIVWPPPCSMRQMRALVAAELPRAVFWPLPASRYAVRWLPGN